MANFAIQCSTVSCTHGLLSPSSCIWTAKSRTGNIPSVTTPMISLIRSFELKCQADIYSTYLFNAVRSSRQLLNEESRYNLGIYLQGNIARIVSSPPFPQLFFQKGVENQSSHNCKPISSFIHLFHC